MSGGLYILGAGGHGCVVAEIAQACRITIAGFIDDNQERWGTQILDWIVLGGRHCIPDGAQVALSIGDNHLRFSLLLEAKRQHWQLPVLAHPSAIISPSAVIEDGTVILPGVVINARAQIGRGCILNTACSIDHDCLLGDAVHIAPGTHLPGNIAVGDRTLIGTGCCARPGVQIGHDAVVGAGSVLINNISAGVIAFGTPARELLR